MDDGLELSLGGSSLDEARSEGLEDRLSILTRGPLISSESGGGAGHIGEEIVLEDIRLTGNAEGDGLDLSSSGLVETHDFVVGDIDGGLGESAHTLLGSVGGVLRKEVDDLVVVDNLVETNVTVSLTSSEEDRGRVVPEGHDDTSSVIDGLLDEGLRHLRGVPDGETTLRLLVETSREDESLAAEPGGASSLDSLMGLNLSGGGTRARIDDTELLILAESRDQRTIPVPLDGLDDSGVTINGVLLSTLLDIPDLNLEVNSRSSEDVVGNRVEGDRTSLTTMTTQLLSGSGGSLGTVLRDRPDLDGRVLRGSGQDVVVEGGEGNIQNRGGVTLDQSDLRQLSSVLQGDDGSSTTSTSSPADGKELRVDRAVVGVPGVLGDLEVGIGLIQLGGRAENVTELRLTNELGHGC